MSDLGEMRLSDVYRGINSSSMTINEESVMDDRDKNTMGMAQDNTYIDKAANVTKVVDNTDKNKLMMGIIVASVLIVLIGILK